MAPTIATMTCVILCLARVGNLKKESKMQGCLKWFYCGVYMSPWSQPCAPDETMWWLLQIILAVDSSPRPAQLGNISYMSVFSLVLQISSLSLQIHTRWWCIANFFACKLISSAVLGFPSPSSPPVIAFMDMWWFIVVGKVWALWNS